MNFVSNSALDGERVSAMDFGESILWLGCSDYGDGKRIGYIRCDMLPSGSLRWYPSCRRDLVSVSVPFRQTKWTFEAFDCKITRLSRHSRQGGLQICCNSESFRDFNRSWTSFRESAPLHSSLSMPERMRTDQGGFTAPVLLCCVPERW